MKVIIERLKQLLIKNKVIFSRLYIKIYLILAGVLLVYASVMFLVIIPTVQNHTVQLEEENGKAQLAKITMLIESVAKNIEDYKKITLDAHKEELKNLVDVTETLVNELYAPTRPEVFKKYLVKKGDEFNKILLRRYNKELTLYGKEAAKKAIIDLIDDYRYDYGVGYFYALEKNTRIIIHPIIPQMVGKEYTALKGIDGKPLEQIPEMITGALKNGSAFIKYKWPNPNTQRFEMKIVYGFLFAPLDWIIATGFYMPEITRIKKREAINHIKNLSYAGTNYFFISDYNNVIISHPYLQGENFTHVRDIYNNLVIPPAIKIAREKGDGFTSYWWKKNTSDDTPYEKLLYSRNYPAWRWVLSTGVYLDDVQKEVDSRIQELIKQLHDTLKVTKIGETGYFYIFDSEANVIIHPDPEWEGKNANELENPGKKTKLFDDLKKAYKSGKKKMYYKWEKVEDKGNFSYDKISWIEYNKYFKWYICSSAYLNEINYTSNNLKEIIFTSTILTLAFVFFIQFFASRKVFAPIVSLSQKTKLVKDGNFSIRSDIRRNDEIGMLAETFDEMLDTIEDNIKMLDKKVYDKTMELTQSNQKLTKSISDLKAAQKQLVESEKMAALGGLVAGVSHEINTPVGMALTGVTHILDEVSLLVEKYDKREMSEDDFMEFIAVSRELGKSIEINLHRAANLVRSFKKIAVDQSCEEMREFFVKEYIEEILISLHNRIKKTRHHIDLEIDPKLFIKNYPGAISQIITNLLLNSIIHGYNDGDEGHISIAVWQKNDFVTIRYEDDGKGISKENLKKIFDPFFTTNREHGGSGLGMNIIYNIITQQLQGTITCESTLGKGVKYVITFPDLSHVLEEKYE